MCFLLDCFRGAGARYSIRERVQIANRTDRTRNHWIHESNYETWSWSRKFEGTENPNLEIDFIPQFWTGRATIAMYVNEPVSTKTNATDVCHYRCWHQKTCFRVSLSHFQSHLTTYFWISGFFFFLRSVDFEWFWSDAGTWENLWAAIIMWLT